MRTIPRLSTGIAMSLLALCGIGRLATAAAPAAEAARTEQPMRIVAYLAGWEKPVDIEPQKLTHIIYAFGLIDAAGQIYLPHPQAAAQLAQLRGLKRQNPRLKILLSVGGWSADGFSDAALTERSRTVFAQSAVALLREHALDGMDIDWEYPGQSAGGIKSRPEDKQNFTLLLQTLRRHFERARAERPGASEPYLLTIASADREYFDYTEMDKLHVYLDWLNVMTYDFFNSLTTTTGHHAGLYPSPLAAPRDRNGDASVKQHLAAGIPADKLVLGLAFYGRAFAGVEPSHKGLNQPYQRFEAAYSYVELVDRFIGRHGFTREWDAKAQAPFLWNPESRTFISYEDPQSIAGKADYVKAQRLGGVMFWELSQDSGHELLDRIVESLRPADVRR